MPLWAKWENSNYLKYLTYLMESQYYSLDRIRELQWQEIKKLLKHAYIETQFYKRKFDYEGIRIEEIKNFDDFEKLPILTKIEVKNNQKELLAKNVPRYMKFLTSGSTGLPLSGYIDKEGREFKRAAGLRSVMWSGCDLGERIYCLYGNPEKEKQGIKKFRAKFRRKYLQRTEILDLLNLSDESMYKFADKMKKYRPGLLWGHAHALYMLADFLENKGIDTIRPKGMYSAGMVLHKHQREKIEKVFNGILQDRYGSEEIGLIATECKRKEGLHINVDSLYVEFLDENNKPVADNKPGNIVITDLRNRCMPFIRYRIEDIGVPMNKSCSCGISQPMIQRIEGRTADFLIRADGKLVSGISLTDHFAGQIPGVKQVQIIQNELRKIEINLVKNHDFSRASKETIDRLVNEFFGTKMTYELKFLKEIPLERSGKYRFTICNIRKNGEVN